jgi:hypothetical protein
MVSASPIKRSALSFMQDALADLVPTIILNNSAAPPGHAKCVAKERKHPLWRISMLSHKQTSSFILGQRALFVQTATPFQPFTIHE